MTEPATVSDPFVTGADLALFTAGDTDTIVAQVLAAVRAYCGWHISPEADETIVLDGRGARHLWLPSLHVTAVESVTNEGVALDVIEDLDWSVDGYVELRRRCAGSWSLRPRQVSVTLTHGYAEAPAELVAVVVAIAARATSSPSGATREQAGQVSFQWATVAAGVSGGVALLQHERELLNRYRLPARA